MPVPESGAVISRFQQAVCSTYPGGATEDTVYVPIVALFHETYSFVVCVCADKAFGPVALNVVGITGVVLVYTALQDVSVFVILHARAWTVPTSVGHVPQSLGQE
jgi:hypothetical protein